MGQVPVTGTGSVSGSMNGHMRAAAAAAARMFLSPSNAGTYPPPASKGGLHAQRSVTSLTRVRGGTRNGGAVDEMGKMRRATIFSPLASPLLLPADKSKDKSGLRNGHGGGSVGVCASPTSFGHVDGASAHKKSSMDDEKKEGGGKGGVSGVRRVTMAFRSVTK
ncbi:hypothetical protein PAXINDRAFT_103228 [Paxillus involutus ATCC 200175]|uniref:Uncharacterized protein n=1 Tax=Paxillus involutus ATCC 200175 TaxID=664439 RepID=A0A0C9SVS1_PAXIN|nr:hypothetical protein PAXINDRAFT_103228 [Paxillus involutus ATCC 200175]